MKKRLFSAGKEAEGYVAQKKVSPPRTLPRVLCWSWEGMRLLMSELLPLFLFINLQPLER